MTLSLYSLHVVLRIPQLWDGYGYAVFARHTATVLAIIVVLVNVIQGRRI